MKKPIIHSHRGLDFGPENTLLAFKGALAAGCGLELDVRLTQDRQIVIIHDNNLQHASNTPGTIADLTVKEIQQHPLFGTDERVPTFDQVTALLKQFQLPQDAIAIHLKLPEQTEAMMQLLADKIAEHALEEVVFIFDLTRAAIDFLKQVNPRLRLSISMGADHHSPTIFTMQDLPAFPDVPVIWWDEWGETNGRSYAGTLYTPENFQLLRDAGRKIYTISPDVAYQTNHPLARDGKYLPVWKNFVRWGVDGICTDQATELIKFLA